MARSYARPSERERKGMARREPREQRDRSPLGVEAEPPEDGSEMWEPPVPDSPIGPEGVPKEEDPGPDA